MNRHFPPPTSAKARANLRRQTKQREVGRATLRDLRIQARAEIDRLLSFLDASDVDPDLEPSLGFPEPDIRTGGGSIYGLSYGSQGDQRRSVGATDDRELDDSDLEPSLCGVSAHGLAVPGSGIIPVEDGEQEAEDEPSLGFLEAEEECGHLGHTAGLGHELEEQCDDEGETSDSGIADADGVMEQCPRLFEHASQRVE